MKRLTINGQELKVQISPTFLQNSACPLYLKLHYVDRIDERFVRIAAERGKAAHAAIAELIKYCMDNRMAVQDIEDEMLREALQRNLSPQIMTEISEVYSWLRLWRERFKLPKNIHGVEERVAIDDEYDECDWKEASYRGIVDLQQVTGTHAIVTDWKSQPHILAQSELDVFEQGTFYCWLMWKMYPHLETFTFRLWYLRYGFYAETHRTQEDLAAFENALIIRENVLMQIDNWEPLPGAHCQYCDFIHLCPIAQDLSPSNPEIITQEQATLAGQQLTVLEVKVKALKDGLKKYVNKNDNVRLAAGFEWGYKHSSGVEWKADEVENALRERDRDLSEVANVGVKQMKKLIKALQTEDPALAQILKDLAKPKHKTEFKGFKSGAGDSDDE